MFHVKQVFSPIYISLAGLNTCDINLKQCNFKKIRICIAWVKMAVARGRFEDLHSRLLSDHFFQCYSICPRIFFSNLVSRKMKVSNNVSMALEKKTCVFWEMDRHLES